MWLLWELIGERAFRQVADESEGAWMVSENALRILCVDNQWDAADSEASLLGLRGFDTRACYDGWTALAVAQEFAPDICLVDLHMPGMDGDELAVRLRDRAAGRPLTLVAVTAAADAESRRRTTEVGFRFHLVKPVDPEVLTQLLHRVAGEATDGV